MRCILHFALLGEQPLIRTGRAPLGNFDESVNLYPIATTTLGPITEFYL